MSDATIRTGRLTRTEDRELESAVRTLLDKIEELDSELTEMEASRDDLQSKLDTALEQLEEANARIKELEDQS